MTFFLWRQSLAQQALMGTINTSMQAVQQAQADLGEVDNLPPLGQDMVRTNHKRKKFCCCLNGKCINELLPLTWARHDVEKEKKWPYYTTRWWCDAQQVLTLQDLWSRGSLDQRRMNCFSHECTQDLDRLFIPLAPWLARLVMHCCVIAQKTRSRSDIIKLVRKCHGIWFLKMCRKVT